VTRAELLELEAELHARMIELAREQLGRELARPIPGYAAGWTP